MSEEIDCSEVAFLNRSKRKKTDGKAVLAQLLISLLEIVRNEGTFCRN